MIVLFLTYKYNIFSHKYNQQRANRYELLLITIDSWGKYISGNWNIWVKVITYLVLNTKQKLGKQLVYYDWKTVSLEILYYIEMILFSYIIIQTIQVMKEYKH
jgi:hypothetical protein